MSASQHRDAILKNFLSSVNIKISQGVCFAAYYFFPMTVRRRLRCARVGNVPFRECRAMRTLGKFIASPASPDYTWPTGHRNFLVAIARWRELHKIHRSPKFPKLQRRTYSLLDCLHFLIGISNSANVDRQTFSNIPRTRARSQHVKKKKKKKSGETPVPLHSFWPTCFYIFL